MMFNPKTVVLIGATEKEGAVGRTILENRLRSKERKIFPINPHTNKVLDVESYPSITGVPEHGNLAVVVKLLPGQYLRWLRNAAGQGNLVKKIREIKNIKNELVVFTRPMGGE